MNRHMIESPQIPEESSQTVESKSGAKQVQVSVIVPAKDEVENLPNLLREIASSLERYKFEILVIDDGSSDGTIETIRKNASIEQIHLRLFRHSESSGQSSAIRTGLLNANGEVVVTIDGDGQNDPIYIPKLLEILQKNSPEVALAGGQRTGRKAGFVKRFASKFANRIRGAMLKDNTRDSGCGLKAIRRDVFLRLPYFDSWHRFLPALVIREGYGVVFIDVTDRQRVHGVSNYGVLDRALVGMLDLFGVWWLKRRRKKIPIVTEINHVGE